MSQGSADLLRVDIFEQAKQRGSGGWGWVGQCSVQQAKFSSCSRRDDVVCLSVAGDKGNRGKKRRRVDALLPR